MALAASAPVACAPLVALLPDHDPNAVQAVACVEDQVRVDPLPLLTVLGLADKETVGVGWVTETVVDWLAFPPGALQVRVYEAFAVSVPVDWVPLKALPPDQAPEAVQAVALVEDQVSAAAEPLSTVLGLALSVTVAEGLGLTVTVVDWTALPPAPVQVSV